MLAVLRVRGTVHVTRKIRETLEMLRLFKTNHVVLVSGEKGSREMVEKVKDYVTYGEISEPGLILLLEKRGRSEGNKRITPEFLKQRKIASYEELAKNLLSGKVKLKDTGFELVFRLNPPKKGYERAGIKKPYKLHGALGYRGEKINELLGRMC